MQQDSNSHGPKEYDLGWWPEILGTILVVSFLSFLIGKSTGIM